MSLTEIIALLNLLILIPISIITGITVHVLRALQQMERRLSRIEGKVG